MCIENPEMGKDQGVPEKGRRRKDSCKLQEMLKKNFMGGLEQMREEEY